MAGNPKKAGKKNPEYQIGRRRHTPAPGYHSVLPRVFPYTIKLSYEDAIRLIKTMSEVGRDGFAVTRHPATTDGHVHLWLSEGTARYLVLMDYVSQDRLETTS